MQINHAHLTELPLQLMGFMPGIKQLGKGKLTRAVASVSNND